MQLLHHRVHLFSCSLEEFGFVKSALKRAIGLLPNNALVGFVSFGTQAQVHELGFSDMSKVYVFRGNKEISKDQIMEQLGLGVSGRRAPVGYPQKGMQNGFPILGITRFLLPASECEYTLNSLLDELQTDQWHKDALKVEIDEHNPDNYLVSFVFDALLDGRLQDNFRCRAALFSLQFSAFIGPSWENKENCSTEHKGTKPGEYGQNQALENRGL